LRKSLKKKNEKIHNRSKSRNVASAGDDCPGIKDHGQWLGEAWPPDHDQRPTGKSAKPPRTKDQTPSYKQQAHNEHISVV